MIERIEIFVTALAARVQRIFSSGSYDTGPAERLLGKPVLVKIHADGIVGCAQIRPISPGHFVPDTTQSVVAAIREIYAPALLGRSIFDVEAINEVFASRLAGNPAARAVLDIALYDAMGKALRAPVHNLIGGCCQPRIPLEWSVSMADDIAVMIAEAKRAIDEFGIRVLCLKMGDRRGWRQDVRNFEAVRRAVGEDILIGADPNEGWTPADALAAVKALLPLGVGYFEQPVARRGRGRRLLHQALQARRPYAGPEDRGNRAGVEHPAQLRRARGAIAARGSSGRAFLCEHAGFPHDGRGGVRDGPERHGARSDLHGQRVRDPRRPRRGAARSWAGHHAGRGGLEEEHAAARGSRLI
jgi:L-alanine-DL-glutamate epimerase-like enolase superfamily enzyme